MADWICDHDRNRAVAGKIQCCDTPRATIHGRTQHAVSDDAILHRHGRGFRLHVHVMKDMVEPIIHARTTRRRAAILAGRLPSCHDRNAEAIRDQNL